MILTTSLIVLNVLRVHLYHKWVVNSFVSSCLIMHCVTWMLVELNLHGVGEGFLKV